MLTEQEDLAQSWLEWKEQVASLEEEYSSIPMNIQIKLVQRDFKDMYGTRADEFINTGGEWPILLENAIAALSKTVKKNILKREWEWMAFKEYPQVLASGMFYVWFPTYSGFWEKDKEEFIKFFMAREEKKEYVKLILC